MLLLDLLSLKKYYNGYFMEIGKNVYKIKIDSVYMYVFKGKCVNKMMSLFVLG